MNGFYFIRKCEMIFEQQWDDTRYVYPLIVIRNC